MIIKIFNLLYVKQIDHPFSIYMFIIQFHGILFHKQHYVIVENGKLIMEWNQKHQRTHFTGDF